MHRHFLTLATVLVLTPCARAASVDALFSDYIQAILAEDWPKAESLWLPEEVALANRLGVEFTGAPLKVDCSSPLIEHRLALRDKLVQLSVADSAIADTLVARTVAIHADGQSAVLTHRYLLVLTPAGWRLTSPIYHATRAWPERRTTHVRVRCPDSTLINQYALDALDRFIDSIGSIFHFRPEHWVTLNDNKLDYYLADRETIRALTGYDAHGMTYLPLDAIVTSHLPHEHELVHAILNYRMAPLPIYTLPALQEGVAVSYGGRWGKSPRVIMQLGAFVLNSGIMKVEDILTYGGFHSDASDLSYALGGLLTRCLIEDIGFPNFSVLYRRLSGPQQYIRKLTEREVRVAIEESTRQVWDLFIPGCVGREVETFSRRGIDPDTTTPHNGVQLFWHEEGDLAIGVYRAQDKFAVGESGPYAGQLRGLAVIDSAFVPGAYKSRLFAEQFPGEQYAGEAIGFVFDSSEAGLYDYRTDILIAKFASGFANDETIWNAHDQLVSFMVDRDLVPVDLSRVQWRILWPQRASTEREPGK